MQTPRPIKGPSDQSGFGQRRSQRREGKRDPWIKWLIALIAVTTPIILAIINSTPERPDRPPQGTKQSPAVTVGRTRPPPVIVQTSSPAPPPVVAQTSSPAPAPNVVPASSIATGTGRLEGLLTDRRGRTISSMAVSVRNGPETVTDASGMFVLPGVLAGAQLLVVRSVSERGREWTQHIDVVPNNTTKVNIAYNPTSSRLGLFLITAPVDGAILEAKHVGQQFLGEVYGRCDALDEIFGPQFDAWVLIRSQLDQRLWVQHPPAIVDLTSGTWKANIQIGNAETPPQNGERWDMIAVAAPASSDIRRILNVTSLSDLPEHIRANSVTVETRIK